MKTLEEVIQNRTKLVNKLAGLGAEGQGQTKLFDDAEMDGVVVLSDELAMRYLEANYVNNTHLAPNRLPGMGGSAGDVVTYQDQTCLTMHWVITLVNFYILHCMREYEGQEENMGQALQSMAHQLSNELRGSVRIHEGILQVTFATGGATMHTYHSSDDLQDAMPSGNDLFGVAAEAGNLPRVSRFGGGSWPGQHYFMLLPKLSFFPLAQERVDTDAELCKLWEEVCTNDGSKEDRDKKSTAWFNATLDLKNEIVKEVVPRLVTERVLGFHIDMKTKNNVALMRPVVAESVVSQESVLIERNGLNIVRAPFSAFLLEDGPNLGEIDSVFGGSQFIEPHEAAHK